MMLPRVSVCIFIAVLEGAEGGVLLLCCTRLGVCVHRQALRGLWIPAPRNAECITVLISIQQDLRGFILPLTHAEVLPASSGPCTSCARLNSASFKQAIAVTYLPFLTAAVQLRARSLWCHSQLRVGDWIHWLRTASPLCQSC